MKSNLWLSHLLAALLAGWSASSAWAQDAAGSTNAVHRPAGVAKSELMDPPGNGTVKSESLNVRSEPNFSSDTLSHVHRGQTVTVFEQLALAKPKQNEPTNWARIALPTNAAVWVAAEYVDTNTMTISARRINVRGGPSDNYTIICRLEKGAPVKEVRRTPDWIQIEPPTNAFGYVAAEYLTIEPGTATPATPAVVETSSATTPATTTAPTTVMPTNTTPADTMSNTLPATTMVMPTNTLTPTNVGTPENVAINNVPTNTVAAAESSTITAPDPTATATTTTTAPTKTVTPATETSTTPTPAPAATSTASAPAATPTTAPVATPDASATETKARVITREGIVHRAINIQAPADFELRDIRTGDVIEYVQPDDKDKNFKKYAGTHVLISGSEWVDRRWPKVPILKVETIEVLP